MFEIIRTFLRESQLGIGYSPIWVIYILKFNTGTLDPYIDELKVIIKALNIKV